MNRTSILASLILVSCASAPKSVTQPTVASVASPPTSSFESLGIRLKLDQRELPNGLKVIMAVDRSVPLINYQTWFNVGSSDEVLGKTGLAHFFEHLMFKGTTKYGPKEFFKQLETKGADVNAFTTRDYTVYHESFTPELLEKVIDMESDRMSNLIINEEVMKTELMVILEERKLRTENSPSGKLQEALWGLAYRRHPYRWPVIGYPQDLVALQVAHLREFYNSFYHPSNAIVVITGNFDADATFKMITQAYGPLSRRTRSPRQILPDLPQNEERRLVLRDEVSSEHFAHAYHITSALEDDSYSLDVLASILFDGSDSRAYRRLVEEKDLLAGISGVAFTPTQPGLFLINGVMKGKGQAESIEPELERLFAEIRSGEISDGELKKAVRQLTVQLVDSVRSPQGLGQLIGTVATVFGDPERFSSDMAKYTRVTAADVKRVATKYLDPNNRSILILKKAQSL